MGDEKVIAAELGQASKLNGDEEEEPLGARINDMLWVMVPHPHGNAPPGSQDVFLEIVDEACIVLATTSMPLSAAVLWPPLRWLFMDASSSPNSNAFTVQLVLKFRPCCPCEVEMERRHAKVKQQ